jgi:hypothetical protein
MSDRLSMARINSVAALHGSGHSNRGTSRLLGVDRGTVNKVVERLKSSGAQKPAKLAHRVLGVFGRYSNSRHDQGTVRQWFEEIERRAPLPLPRDRFAMLHEARRAVRRGGHVEVDKAPYSAPPEDLVRRVWVRWGHVSPESSMTSGNRLVFTANRNATPQLNHQTRPVHRIHCGPSRRASLK